MADKILIVEDDMDDQLLFTDAITEFNPFAECVSVYNGAEALQHLSNTNTLPSLILLDLNMPLMNGYEFLKLIKVDLVLNKIPVVIFSTSSSSFHDDLLSGFGANQFFVKSPDAKEFKRIVQNILSRY